MIIMPLMAKGAYSGSCGPTLTYSFDVITMTLTISGTGTMNDFSLSPWFSFREAILKMANGQTKKGVIK